MFIVKLGVRACVIVGNKYWTLASHTFHFSYLSVSFKTIEYPYWDYSSKLFYILSTFFDDHLYVHIKNSVSVSASREVLKVKLNS